MTEIYLPLQAPRIYVERTLALIKPDAIKKAEEIEDIILRSGFCILQVCEDLKNIFVLLATNVVISLYL